MDQILIALLPIVLTLVSLSLLIIALIHLKCSSNAHKVAWLLIIVFTPIVGPTGYLIINRQK
jgi:hypothetical protein